MEGRRLGCISTSFPSLKTAWFSLKIHRVRVPVDQAGTLAPGLCGARRHPVPVVEVGCLLKLAMGSGSLRGSGTQKGHHLTVVDPSHQIRAAIAVEIDQME